ncbi:hypothetical protein GXW82_06365 [Streptacidiphilus sp. 4-A2]|nr:hypothetical protein [Streptacidiphilus sp. 4-A2]
MVGLVARSACPAQQSLPPYCRRSGLGRYAHRLAGPGAVPGPAARPPRGAGGAHRPGG